MNDKVSSTGSFRNLEIALSHSIDVADVLSRKLLAVQSIPKSAASAEEYLTVVLPSHAASTVTKRPTWPNQLAQSILDMAAHFTGETCTLAEAMTSVPDHLEARVLELGLRSLRVIVELELVVTDAGKEVDANRIGPGLLYFRKSFQQMLVLLDKVLVRSKSITFPTMFVGVSLFFLIEHSIVNVCRQLGRAWSIEHNNQTPASGNDDAVVTICALAKSFLARRSRKYVSQEEARVTQLHMANGTPTHVTPNVI
jgi:hypothetical protein